jgi:hypothetical protein
LGSNRVNFTLREAQVKADRWFFSTAGGIFLVVMLIGFHLFISRGSGFEGRNIDPAIFPLVTVHGLAIAGWYVLFFIQSLLINVRKPRLHMKLGWSAVAIGLAITLTGSLVAIRSVQISPPTTRFFDMEYSRFLLVMLTEIVMFTMFVAAGIATRKQPQIHRAMMLLASLSLLAGATARIRPLYSIFGESGWVGLFGPVFCLGAALLGFRCAMTRKFDRMFVAGYAVWVIAYVLSAEL